MPESRFHFVIPTYKRPRLIQRCIRSIYTYVPSNHLGMIVVINQSDYPISDAIELKMEPGWPGPRRRTGAEYILNYQVPDTDLFCFLDDDIQLNNTFTANCNRLINLALQRNIGCIQLAWRQLKPGIVPIKLGFTGGGIVVQVFKYKAFGGYGNDYLDDVELFLRSYIAGFQNYRFNDICSRHSRDWMSYIRSG